MLKLSERIEWSYGMMRLANDNKVAFASADPVPFDGRTISLGGRSLLNFANCCYLGFETDPRVTQAAMDATARYGMLMSNSRAYFSSPLYIELEELLNEMMPGHVVVFPTTTLGHCSNLPVLIDREDLIICDTHAHNSIQMAAKLCVAEGVELARLPHNDMSALEEFVSKPEHEGRRLWFLGDGIYSMQGEFLDLDNLVQTLNRHPNLYAYIDDAHGFGWSGKNGAGFVLGGGSSHPQLITTVSMCKSFGSFGGVAVFPDESLADRLRHVGQTQVFSSPLPTAVLGASVASAKIHLSDQLPSYQAELEEKIRYFRSECNRVADQDQVTHANPVHRDRYQCRGVPLCSKAHGPWLVLLLRRLPVDAEKAWRHSDKPHQASAQSRSRCLGAKPRGALWRLTHPVAESQ
jgi:7-keto-8-aminopelargonate synthetase-like enzyme